MSDQQKDALCCVCGTVRKCRRPRNHREENYWLSGRIDLDWHRETGDLKCAECGRVTTHAILHPEGDWAQDHAEVMQRLATGNSHGHFTSAQLDEVAKKYRQGLPRNPKLNHWRYDNEAQEAWDRGDRVVPALCGEPITIHRDPSGPASKGKNKQRQDDRQFRPREVRDQEYEDADTGLWWQEMDCVDCLRVWHLELLRHRREKLAVSITGFLADLLADKGGYPKKIDLGTVNSLIDALDAARERSTSPSKDTAR